MDLASGSLIEYDRITKLTVDEYLNFMDYTINKKKQEAKNG